MINHGAVQAGKVWRAVLLGAGLVIVVGASAGSQDQPKPSGEIKMVPVQPNNVVHGTPLYRQYCAACHGTAGKGNGPAAPALKTPPADLTMLAKNNNGKFPDRKVLNVLENGTDVAAHGSKDMPTWGPIFRSIGPENLRHLREANLIDYLKSIQEK